MYFIVAPTLQQGYTQPSYETYTHVQKPMFYTLIRPSSYMNLLYKSYGAGKKELHLYLLVGN